jgi:hypothetical protein
MPAGGWRPNPYTISIPDPTEKTRPITNNATVTGSVDITNASGIDWPASIPIFLFSTPNDVKELGIGGTGKELLDTVPNHSTETKPISETVEIQYAWKASSPFKAGDINPKIVLTSKTDFPPDGASSNLIIQEGLKSLPGFFNQKLAKNTATIVGDSYKTIKLDKNDSQEAIGLSRGVVFYRNVSKLSFSNPLEVPVQLENVCGDMGCCDGSSISALPASNDGDNGQVTLQAKDGKPRELPITSPNSTWNSADIGSRIKALQPLVSAASECQCKSLAHDVSQAFDALSSLKKTIDGIDGLQPSLEKRTKCSCEEFAAGRNNSALKKRADLDMAALQELKSRRQHTIERYDRFVTSLDHPITSCCDLVPQKP